MSIVDGKAYLTFYSTIQTAMNITLSCNSMTSLYTYPNNIGIQKKLGNVEIDNYVQSRFITTYSSQTNTNTYDIINSFELTNDKFEITRPLQYTNDFYSNFSSIQMPLSSMSLNSNNGKYFYSTYPYYKYLTQPTQLSISNLNSSSIFIIKDIYLNYNINNAYLILPPVSYFGQAGYRIFINGNMLVLNQNFLTPLPSNYANNFDMSNLIPSMITQLDEEYNWYSNPVNINYMFSIGHNRIAIELIYDNSITYQYPDGNLCFQMDLIINDKYIISSGLFTENNPFYEEYTTLNDNTLSLYTDNTIMIFTNT